MVTFKDSEGKSHTVANVSVAHADNEQKQAQDKGMSLEEFLNNGGHRPLTTGSGDKIEYEEGFEKGTKVIRKSDGKKFTISNVF
jgi:hypothetical protein